MLRQFRNYLVMGFIVLLPTIATLYVLHLIFVFIDRILGNFLTDIFVTSGLLDVHPATGKIQFFGLSFEDRIPGIGFILLLIILILVGYATKSIFGKRAIHLTEQTFKKIPIARTIYSTVQQITTAVTQERSSFKKVVLVEYPRKGIFTMGFLTGEAQGEVQEKSENECVNVFLPTTPNPTSGWLVLVPKEDVILLDMTIEQGLKYIISGGVVAPPHEKQSLEKEEEDVEEILHRIKLARQKDRMKVNILSKRFTNELGEEMNEGEEDRGRDTKS